MFVTGAIPENILGLTAADSKDAGAVAVFVGKVRADIIDDREVESIEFSAQQTIAELQAAEIIEESKKRFGIFHAEIWHSLGNVKAGEPCFLVKVFGKHRRESFSALPFIVDEVKHRCPVFGKEIFSGGDYKWKENTA